MPDGDDMEKDKVCTNYDSVIETLGGIDLQLLGLGMDGHIGFNEPGVSFNLQTHVVNLHESTINANQKFFEMGEQVPKQAYTVGIKSILQARKVVMIVSGEEKAEIVREAFLGPVTSTIPASILQLHPDFILITDKLAGKYIYSFKDTN
jgi:glucosamine-6-phosphate deaminase